MATASSTVLVVGAGVVGRSVAYYLALRGIEVHIIDAGAGFSSGQLLPLQLPAPYAQAQRELRTWFSTEYSKVW